MESQVLSPYYSDWSIYRQNVRVELSRARTCGEDPYAGSMSSVLLGEKHNREIQKRKDSKQAEMWFQLQTFDGTMPHSVGGGGGERQQLMGKKVCCLVFVVLNRFLLCSLFILKLLVQPSWPGTGYVDKADLELKEIQLSVSSECWD